MGKSRGFTLIEMISVMVLLGLLAGIILPNFERWFESTQDKVSATEISNSLQKLLTRSALLEQDFTLHSENTNEIMSDKKPALNLPAGWILSSDQKIHIWRTGICSPALVKFINSEKEVILEIEDESCIVSIKSQAHAKKN